MISLSNYVSLVERLLKENEQVVRYFAVSFIALVVDFSVLIFAREIFGLNYLVAATIGFCCGVVVNYLLSIRWVFHTSRFSRRSVEFGLTALIATVGLGINDLIVWLLTSEVGMFYLVSKCFAALCVFIWNFVVRKVALHPSPVKA